MRKINKIVIHCSASPEGRDDTIEEIRRWHRQRGWRDVGYHYVIRLDGTVERGRPESRIGAHCQGHNADSIAICYIGGVAKDGKTPKDTRTEEQKAAIAVLIAEIRGRYGTELRVYGHNRLTCRRSGKGFDNLACEGDCSVCRHAAKACPSFGIKVNEF